MQRSFWLGLIGLAVLLGLVGLGLSTTVLIPLRSIANPKPTIVQPVYQTDNGELADAISQALGTQSDQNEPARDSHGAIVSHHLPTALPAIGLVYRTLLYRTTPVRRLIVLGPDHRDRATHSLVTTRGLFVTPFGDFKPDLEAIDDLVRTGDLHIEDEPFQHEHSIGVQAAIGRLAFPSAKIVPIVIRSSTTPSQAEGLGQRLGRLVDAGTIVIASVDFSHYYPERQARALDQTSAEQIQEGTQSALRLVRSDSTQALIALLAAMSVAHSTDFSLLGVDNSSQWSGDRDWTTGYVSGVYR